MTSEDTVPGAVTPTLEQCLGQFQERVSSLENCPWCSSKGLAYALRSYRINFQESITLCTNSQCLFPLVSRPLEEVLAELAPVEEHIGGKRKVLENDDAAVLPSKRLRSNGDEQVLEVANLLVTEEEPPAIEADGTEFKVLHDTCAKALRSTLPSEGLTPSEAACQGESAKDKSDYVLVPTCSPPAGETALASASPLSSEGVLGATSAVFASRHASEMKDEAPSDVLFRQANGPLHGGLRPGNLESNQCRVPVEDPVDNNFALPPADELIAQKPCPLDSDGTSMLTEGTTNEVKPEALTPTSDQADQEKNMENVPPQQMDTEGPEKLVSLPPRLFWKNSDNLCWLDTLLVALVNCKSLRDHRPRDMPQKSPVWELIRKYDEICAAVQAHQHTGTDGVVRVPIRVLQNAYSDLQSIRKSVFKLLQPKLQCRLGQRETPVFALPVLVAADSWAESLFEQTFHWEFEVSKSLPTFTNLVQDWHPENAAHMAPCNVCHKKNQRRTMVLDSIPPVFALHFVDGLPDNDLQMFSFSFHGRRYSVSTVIQYSKTIKHFVAWIRTPNGLWQEFDDLKHPGCNSHAKLPVPASEMHIVFWEMEEDPTRHTCSPIVEAPPSHNRPNHTIPLAKSPDKSLLPSYEDSDIVGALALSVEGSVTKGAMATMDMDASIGSTTLLDTFEGLSHSDIVTLTLIEVRVDSEGKPLADVDQTPETGSPDTFNVMSDLTRQETPSEVLSDPDTADDMSSDPTFVLTSSKRKRRTPVKPKGRRNNKSRQLKRKTSPVCRAASKRAKKVPAPVVTTAAAQETPPDPTTQLAAATVSSSSASPPPCSQKSPELPPVPILQDRWTYLLSKRPQVIGTPTQFSSPETPAASPAAAPEKSPVPIQCTPNPAKRPRPPLFKPQLMRESSELPLKHARMYDAFSASSKTTSTSSPHQTPPWQATAHPAQCGSKSNTPLSTALPVPPKIPGHNQNGLPKAAASGKRDRLSDVQDDLGNTDTLRCKLLKKLKAKQKKLAKLNRLLGQKGEAAAEARPDSTERRSPQAVTSSTTGSTYDEFLSNLLSPASTASNLSPDSTGLLEMLANGKEVADQLDQGLNSTAVTSQVNYSPHCSLTSNNEDFLEEFLSGVAAQQQTETETQALHELDLFF
ncbi:SUMO-specific isopeptidase USPL1 [Merluccius polli]|uniref:SUMO-specific isopeptidase USPL1 n=1 Tax=Merluccius polli TaxID=89951 RepID=A0AA47NQZ7_MERPO|nr:SUMO-specific isopeptidase USPL1 [Merluccius polli]